MKQLLALVVAAALSLGMSQGLAVKERPKYPCAFQQKVSGRWTGSLSLQEANRLRVKSVRVGQRIAVRLNDVTQADAPFVIRCVFSAYGLDWRKAQSVANCESHFDPEAYNPNGHGGIYQHNAGAWPVRAKLYDHAGAPITDGYSAIHVTAQMVRAQGNWSGWACA